MARTSFYDIQIRDLQGKAINLSEFKGKHLLFVNVASKCGFTPQYESLEKLSNTYKNSLIVIGVPCNQFGKQEPGTSKEIQSFCDLNYGVTFPLSEKIEVNGSNAHPIYKYLKSELKGKLNDSIKWNFTKFLIDRDGTPYKRFSATVEPEDIKPYISELL